MELDISFDEKVSTHSRAEAAATQSYHPYYCFSILTHSHPKVAAHGRWITPLFQGDFNTQPPEGGC